MPDFTALLTSLLFIGLFASLFPWRNRKRIKEQPIQSPEAEKTIPLAVNNSPGHADTPENGTFPDEPAQNFLLSHEAQTKHSDDGVTTVARPKVEDLSNNGNGSQRKEVLWCGQVIHPVIYDSDDEGDLAGRIPTSHKNKDFVVEKDTDGQSALLSGMNEEDELEKNTALGLIFQGDGIKYKTGPKNDDCNDFEGRKVLTSERHIPLTVRIKSEDSLSTPVTGSERDSSAGSSSINICNSQEVTSSHLASARSSASGAKSIPNGVTHTRAVRLEKLGDWLRAQFERQGNVRDIDSSILILQQVLDLTPDGHFDQPFRLSNLGVSLQARFERLGAMDDIDNAIRLQKRAVGIVSDEHPDMVCLLTNLAISLKIRFLRQGETADINGSIFVLKRAINLISDGHADKPTLLNNLGNSLKTKFDRHGDLVDIDNAILTQQQALGMMSDGDRNKPSWSNNLAISLKTRFDRSGHIADIDSAIFILKRIVDRTPDGHTEKPSWLSNLAVSMRTRFEKLGDTSDIDHSIHFHKQAVNMTPDGLPDKPLWLSDLGVSLRIRFEKLGDVVDIDSAILNQRRAVDLTSDGDVAKVPTLVNLGNSLGERFRQLGDIDDINTAINIQQQAINLTPAEHTKKPVWLTNLALLLQRRFKQLGDLNDLDEAIATQQQAVDLTPDGHADQPSRLRGLAHLLQNRFERLGDRADIDNALTALQQAINLTPDDHTTGRSLCLNNLGLLLVTRFEQLGNITDINDAIRTLQTVINLTPDGHSFRPSFLDNLGKSLQVRFEHAGNIDDIDTAIIMKQQAVNLTLDGHSSKPSILSHLGLSLKARFERLGDTNNINNAILHHQQALNLTPERHVERPFWLSNLASSLESRFKRLGDIADIDNAILTLQEAIDLTPGRYAKKPFWLSNLGELLRVRYEALGNMVDIDRAILMLQQAVDLTPDGYAHKPIFLGNLGISLQRRFMRLGDASDIDSAVLLLQHAVQLTPDEHPDKPSQLNSLGNSFSIRFDGLGNREDLDSAIFNQQKSVTLTLDEHVEKPARLNNLGLSLKERFEVLKDMSDLDSALTILRQAVVLAPQGYAHKAYALNNLGNCLQNRFVQLGDVTDIDNAILTLQQAVHLTADGHASKSSVLGSLASSLLQRFRCNGNPEDYHRIISSLRAAALSPTGPPLIRFSAARNWGAILYPELEPYHLVIALIPQVIWLGRTVEQRVRDLEELKGEGLEAVSAACTKGYYDLALEWSEQGRGIIWGQTLQLRSPLDDLQAIRPDLASELSHIAASLEAAGTGNRKLGDSTLSQEQMAQDHRRLAARWEALLVTVRELPGLTDFLRPKPASVLKKASTNGTIVVVNVSRFRSDALILQSGSSSVVHIQLPTLSLEKVNTARNAFYQSLRTAGVRFRETNRGSISSQAQDTIPKVLKMLWNDVARPILNHFGYTTPPPAGNLPHITWCLTGALATLPLHAAGIYDTTDGQEKLFNYIVSSYAPSLTSLIEGSERIPVAPNRRRLLAITQQDTPTFPPLPGTMREVDQIKMQIEKHNISLTRMDSDQATVKNVSEGMNTHSWIHLSCHGKQDALELIKSAFFLHDGTLDLAEIMKKPLKHAELAYLSACQTASGDLKFPDEAIHLAAGMFIAGYRSVVATLWSIKDDDAPLVAERFYERLLGNPDGGVAGALHEAVGLLRDKVGENNFLSWVPYIHIGH